MSGAKPPSQIALAFTTAAAIAVHGGFNALAFFTRIRCPDWVDYSPTYQRYAIFFWPLIGWLVGAVAALVLVVAAWFLPTSVAVLLSLVAALLLTGALHEDGFADVCDGLGAGGSPDRILGIMKDPCAGVFAVIGGVLLLMLKATLLFAIIHRMDNSEALSNLRYGISLGMLTVLISAHALSRLAALSLVYRLPYISSGQRAGAMTEPRGIAGPVFAGCCGFAPLLALATWNPSAVLVAIVAVVLVMLYLTRLFVMRLGGYSGDCLGAAQQLSEVAIYLGICAVLRSSG